MSRAQSVKQVLKRTPLLGAIVQRLSQNLRLHRKQRRATQLPSLIEQSLSARDAIIVQIGANDGIVGDPLHELIQTHVDWQVLFVEPVPYLFERLKLNYGLSGRFKYENAAINDGSTCNFYWVGEEAGHELLNLPRWWDQLASFDKEHILRHLDGRLGPYIRTTVLNGLTLNQLIDKHDLNRIDLLYIDTEGHDWQILRQLDLSRIIPEAIVFEHFHLTAAEKQLASEFLSINYYLTMVRGNIFARKKRSVRRRTRPGKS